MPRSLSSDSIVVAFEKTRILARWLIGCLRQRIIEDMLKGIWRDLIYAGRLLVKARSFTIVCVVTLGIGMAPVIAIPYGARLLTITPPLVKAHGIVAVLTMRLGPRAATENWPYRDYVDLRAVATYMTLTCSDIGNATVQTPAGTVDSPTLFVSSNYFETLGVALARGAGFEETIDDLAEHKRDSARPKALTGEPLVILAHTFWKNRLGSD